MNRSSSSPDSIQALESAAVPRTLRIVRLSACCTAVAVVATCIAVAQVITIDTRNPSGNPKGATVDRRYQQITPTKVTLAKSELDPRTRTELIRLLQAEQGFAMRPFPRGRKGLTLNANGNLDPAGERYLEMVVKEGLSAKPGDRLVVTGIKFDKSKMIFDLNGGPDPKHRILRHVQIGGMGTMNPVVGDDGQEPVGSRLTLNFPDHVPELTGSDVKALLAPLISFDVKTPIQAFTDTLPKPLKDAILSHHVLVGMSTEMVLFAKGQPEAKSRETEGQMPFEEWIYGEAPKDVEFVRINGNRVIRVEVAKVGEKPVIFTKDEVEGLMRTDGTPVIAEAAPHVHTVGLGDVEHDPDTQAAAPPPTLKAPGETVSTNPRVTGEMKPVQEAKPRNPDPALQPGTNIDLEPEADHPATAAPPPGGAQQP